MEEQIKKRSKGRSPSYPGINLETAIERAKTILEKEGKHFVPISSAFIHWGYKPKSSGGLIACAALKKFGLIEYDEGSKEKRKLKLSELALKILWDEREDSADRSNAIKEAALNPIIHKELWEKYDKIPSDETLKYELRHKKFMESVINDFIQEYRETLSFAKLEKSDIILGHEEDKSLKKEDRNIMSSDSLSGLQSTLKIPTIEMPIPVSPTELVVMKIPYPLSEEGWKQLLTILPMYKPGLVQPIQTKDETKEN